MKERIDDFSIRRKHLQHMTDVELKAYFLELADKIVDPLLDLAYKNTSKSIERSILLRMGFNSLEAKAIVDRLQENNLLRKGSGQCVYLVSQKNKISIREAGLLLENGQEIEYLNDYFEAKQ